MLHWYGGRLRALEDEQATKQREVLDGMTQRHALRQGHQNIHPTSTSSGSELWSGETIIP